MASICVHRASQTPPDIAPGHISSRDVLQEGGRTATELPHKAARARLEPGLCPGPLVHAIHLTRQSPFHGPPEHLRSRDGIDLCPSSAANPSRHRSKAHRLARCFFMSGAPQRQQLASERTPLTSFAPAPSTVSCVPLTRNLSPADPSPSTGRALKKSLSTAKLPSELSIIIWVTTQVP